jgi:hypothetical protein
MKKGGKALFLISNKYYPHLYHYKRMSRKHYALGRNWNHGPERKISHWEATTLFAKHGMKITRSYGLNPIENKIFKIYSKILRKIKMDEKAEFYEEKAKQLFVSESTLKPLSETLAYEITI